MSESYSRLKDSNSSQRNQFSKNQIQYLNNFDDGTGNFYSLSNGQFQNQIDQSDRWPEIQIQYSLSQNQFLEPNELIQQSQIIQESDKEKSKEKVEQSQIIEESSEQNSQQNQQSEYQQPRRKKTTNQNSAKNCYNTIKQKIIEYLSDDGQPQIKQLIRNYQKSGNNKKQTLKLIKKPKLAAQFAKMFLSNHLKLQIQLTKVSGQNFRKVCRQIERLKRYFISQSPSYSYNCMKNADIQDIYLR